MKNLNELINSSLIDFNESTFDDINRATKYLNRIVKTKEDTLTQAVINKQWSDIYEGFNWFGKNLSNDVLNNFYTMQIEKEDISKIKIFLQYESINTEADKFYDYVFSFLKNIEYLNELQIHHPLKVGQLVLKHYEANHFSTITDDNLRTSLIDRFNLQPDMNTLSHCITHHNYNYFVETSKLSFVKNHFFINRTAAYPFLLQSVNSGDLDIFSYIYTTFKPEIPLDFFQIVLDNNTTIARKITNQKPEKFQLFCDCFNFTSATCQQLVEGLLKSQKYNNINCFLTKIHERPELLEATKSSCVNFPNDPFKIHLLSYIDKCSLYSSLNKNIEHLTDNNTKKMKI